MEIFNGVDILDIKRIDAIYKKFGERFEKKILSNQEIILFKKKKHQHIRTLAGIFSSKESMGKAMGTGISKDVKFKDIEVLKDNLGRPHISLKNNTLRFLKIKKDKYKNHKISLSISHEKNMVVTFVTMLFY